MYTPHKQRARANKDTPTNPQAPPESGDSTSHKNFSQKPKKKRQNVLLISQKHLYLLNKCYFRMLERYKEILKELGLTGKDVSELMGMSYSSYRSMTRKGGRYLPKWVVSFVVSHELSKK